MSVEFKRGDIVRYVPRSDSSNKDHHDKIGMILGKDGGLFAVLWSPFDSPIENRLSDGSDWGALPENLDLIGHIDEES